MSLFVISGYSGSGKTYLIKGLEEKGYQVIDLEKLSSHNGSVFGHLTNSFQPTPYQFKKSLLKQWNAFNLKEPVFVENKPLSLGKLIIPGWFFSLMNQAPVILLKMEKELRIKNICLRYKDVEPLKFKEALLKLAPRMNKGSLYQVLYYFNSSNFEKAVEILLEYYDSGFYYNPGVHRIKHSILIKRWDVSEIIEEIVAAAFYKV